MKKKNLTPLGVALYAILFFGCAPDKSQNGGIPLPLGSVLVADTITYDISLRAMDTTSAWDVELHKYIRQEVLVDNIFSRISTGDLVPFDFYTGQKLSDVDIARIEAEEGYSRSRISKIQFKEFWYIDSLGTLQRVPLGYTLGMELYSQQGSFLGHKALFMVRQRESE